jgi:hypothetical protein
VYAVQAPLHEVLAVVGEQAVTLLAEPRARAANGDFRAHALLAVFDHEHRAAAGKCLQRHLFDGATNDVVHQRTVVHHLAVACIQAVMRET